MNRIKDKKDVLLLLLYSPTVLEPELRVPIVGRTRLVKMIFLFSKELFEPFTKGTSLSLETFYDFFEWHFGPFSTQVYDDINFFLLRSFIQSEQIDSQESTEAETNSEMFFWLEESTYDEGDMSNTMGDETFSLTDKGAAFIEPIYNGLTIQQKDMLRQFKDKFCDIPLRTLLRYVYSRYPEYTTKSLIKDKVLS